VTAVLLNFRGYDTLLEIAVLTVALVGVWALGPRRASRKACRARRCSA
jgi:multisubunit Na+/H+ antiporter MnhB subunit